MFGSTKVNLFKSIVVTKGFGQRLARRWKGKGGRRGGGKGERDTEENVHDFT